MLAHLNVYIDSSYSFCQLFQSSYNCLPMSLSTSLGRRIGGNALVKLAAELAGRVATFALALFAARRLSEADFGFYNYGLAVGFVVAQQIVEAQPAELAVQSDKGLPV
jgi:hypothetical protein